ncbi:MAG: hypothetical protein LC121_04715 [Anaerolineae bacterium]|nr:hypothetical protein [Anaerolineae bacterium]
MLKVSAGVCRGAGLQVLAAIARTTTFLLLAYLVDHVLLQDRIGEAIVLIALSFIGSGGRRHVHLREGQLAAETAEGMPCACAIITIIFSG